MEHAEKILELLQAVQKENKEAWQHNRKALVAIAGWLKIFHKELETMSVTLDQLNTAIAQVQTDLNSLQTQLAGTTSPDLSGAFAAVGALDTQVNNMRANLPPVTPVTPPANTGGATGTTAPAGTTDPNAAGTTPPAQ